MALNEPSLLDRFRTGTRAAQDALERAQRRFDLTRPAGLSAFLAAQADCVACLTAAKGDLVPALKEAAAVLAADRAALGATDAPDTRTRPQADDPLARGYVWHGQRLALRMLSRQVPGGDGSAYIRMPRDADAWRALCVVLEETPGYGAAGDAALVAANNWLALFETIHHDHARR